MGTVQTTDSLQITEGDRDRRSTYDETYEFLSMAIILLAGVEALNIQ